MVILKRTKRTKRKKMTAKVTKMMEIMKMTNHDTLVVSTSVAS